MSIIIFVWIASEYLHHYHGTGWFCWYHCFRCSNAPRLPNFQALVLQNDQVVHHSVQDNETPVLASHCLTWNHYPAHHVSVILQYEKIVKNHPKYISRMLCYPNYHRESFATQNSLFWTRMKDRACRHNLDIWFSDICRLRWSVNFCMRKQV